MTDSSYEQTVAARQSEAKEKFLAVMRETPLVEYACRKAGISRTTYHRWRRQSKKFDKKCAEARREGIEHVSDISEAQLIQLIKEKKMAAISLWLKYHHKSYGAKSQDDDESMRGKPIHSIYGGKSIRTL